MKTMATMLSCIPSAMICPPASSRFLTRPQLLPESNLYQWGETSPRPDLNGTAELLVEVWMIDSVPFMARCKSDPSHRFPAEGSHV